MLNRNIPIPMYVQVADTLREQILSGKIKPGDKLPGETEMIKEYKLGRLTIRDALSILVNEGLFKKHHGKGTFCKNSITQPKTKVDLLLNLSDLYFIPYYLRSICDVPDSENVNIVLSDTKKRRGYNVRKHTANTGHFSAKFLILLIRGNEYIIYFMIVLLLLVITIKK